MLNSEIWQAFSFKRCCFFLLIFLLFMLVAVGIAALIVIFVFKPEKPVFSMQTIRLESYELDANSCSILYVSSVITLTLKAQNPNKIGLRYSPSRLSVHYKGLPIGIIRVPRFFQPAHSNNVSVQTRVLFQSVNVSQIVAEAPLHEGSKKNIVQMNILGDVIIHISLLKIKFALDCDINIDYKELALKNEVYIKRIVQDHFASFPTISEFFSMKCAFALYR